MFDFDVVTGPSNILRTDEPAKAQAPANPQQAPRGARQADDGCGTGPSPVARERVARSAG
jgi:hypothetical protein